MSDGKGSEEEEEEEVEDTRMKASPDAETTILFTNRPQESKILACLQYSTSTTILLFLLDFVAGQLVQSLIGLYNKGKEHFVVSGIEASFRYRLFGYELVNLSVSFLQISSRLQLFHSKCMSLQAHDSSLYILFL